MHSLLSRFFVILTAVLLCNCSDQEPADPGPSREPASLSGEPTALDGEHEVIESGRAEILTAERHLIRRGREGIERVQCSVTLPQLVGDEDGIVRINGFLRHLALDWPRLPRAGSDSPEEAAALMHAIAEGASNLRPEDWPARAQLESLEGLVPEGYFGEEEILPHQEDSTFSIRIVRLDADKVVLHLDLHSAGGALSIGYEGEFTLDLRSGDVVGFAVIPEQEE